MRIWMLVCAVAATLWGCGGCNDPCRNVECSGGLVCAEGLCVDETSTCDPRCGVDEVCQGGECVTLEAQCEQSGDVCDASLPTNDGFTCVDYDGFGPREGECVEPCASDGSCPSGAQCFFLAGFADEACTTTLECPSGKQCAQGACRDTICRPSECDGFLTGAEQCASLYATTSGFESGAQCYNVGNEARYCYPAGTRGAGETCTAAFDAIIGQTFGDTCAPGLACVDGACSAACSDDAVCSGDDSCILEEQDLVDTGVGVCGQSCTPFEPGSCGASESCIPVTAEEGVCVPAGATPAFEACTPGAGECVDGTLCVTYQDGSPAVARCQPICNTTVGPAGEDGSVGDFAQSQRDATCPQSAEPASYLEFVNLAEIGTDVDVYFDDEQTPRLQGVAFGARTDGDPDAQSAQWIELPPANYAVRILPAMAPRTDPPLDELTLTLGADEAASVVLLPIPGVSDEARALVISDVPDEVPPTAPDAAVRVFHGLADAMALDVIAVPTGDDLTDPTTQRELAVSLPTDGTSAFTTLPAGDWDVLVFTAQSPRDDRAAALIEGAVSVMAATTSTVALRGTINLDDTPGAGITLVEFVSPPEAGSRGPAYTCVDLGNEVFGVCQQDCGNDPANLTSDLCLGDAMACHPTYLSANFRYANLCSPLGAKAIDEACNPRNAYTECGAGLYCLEYGNSADGFDAENRGRCTSYCDVTDPSDSSLTCAAGQGCQAIPGGGSEYATGMCGFSCEPDMTYSDAACPAGLKACKPVASLQADPSNPDRPPDTRVEPSFCSSSGDIEIEGSCFASDCAPGSECMFPRSAQTDFTSTLLSQYFGGPGLSPSCQPQCDPFDGDSSSTRCGADETCLFNFPWSAEVGHCAPIAERRTPLDGCEFPGEACGEDSICVLNGGAAICFQFCQYAGPSPQGELQRESCGTGLICAPLVNDIGVCLSP